MKICMEKSKGICLGKSKVTRTNYTYHVSLPKALRMNMKIDAGDSVGYFADADGDFKIIPIREQQKNAEEKVQ